MKNWMMSLLLVCLTTALHAAGASDVAKNIFGSREAEKKNIEKGAIFIDGNFIPAPYTLKREGNLILVNDRVAARFLVDDKEDEAEGEDSPELQDSATPARRQSARDAEQEKRLKAEEFRKKGMKGGSLADKAKAREKAKAPKPKAEFNREASSSGGNGLFEEADYTYTPPSKPEPKAVPYIRPAAKKSLKEIVAERDAIDAAKRVDTAALAADEAFKALDEEEVARYRKSLDARLAKIEEALQKDALVFFISTNMNMKLEGRKTMYKFVANFEKDAKGKADAFVKEWPDLPKAYLKRIHTNRSTNLKQMKTLIARVTRELKAAKKDE